MLVVGYQTYELEKGYNLYAPVFESTTETAYNLQDIKMIGALNEGNDFVQLITTGGSLGKIYRWYDGDNSPDGGEGWYDGDDYVTDVMLTADRGFYICAYTAGVSLQTSGAVRLGKLPISLEKGYTVIGNSSPVDIDLTDIKLIGALNEGNDFVQLITTGGSLGKKYCWYDGDNSPDGGEGWYDGDDPLESYPIKAGQGLYICAYTAGASLELPAVITQ